MKVVIYLAGDLLGGEERWRPKVVKAIGNDSAEFLSPIDDCTYKYYDFKQRSEDEKVFALADLAKVDACHILFAYVRESPSRHSGTSAEIGYAKARGKKIFLVNDMKKTLWHLYEFIDMLADKNFDTLSRGIEYLKRYIAEMNYKIEENSQ